MFKRDIFGKIVKVDELAGICIKHRRAGRKISCTSGSFDLIHDGHIKYLIRAAELGDVLIVGVDSDELVKRFKGEVRPILPGYVRVLNIASHEHVDFTCLIASTLEIIEVVKPNVFVMSKSTGDAEERTAEQKLVESFGGKVIALEPMSSLHSTELMKRIALLMTKSSSRR